MDYEQMGKDTAHNGEIWQQLVREKERENLRWCSGVI